MNLLIDEDFLEIETDDGCFLSAIDRKTFQTVSRGIPKPHQKIPFQGILGVYKAEEARFLAVIQQTEQVTSYANILKVTAVYVLQITTDPDSDSFISLLQKGFKQCPMYYSSSVDLSLSYQAQLDRLETRENFVWNWIPIQQLRAMWPGLTIYTPVIAGFVGASDPFVLISRRSRFNAGVHYWNRGADNNGHSANFFETEELAIVGETIVSFVQLRGSCPLFWTQFPTGSWGPPIKFGSSQESVRRFHLHFDYLKQMYGDAIVVASLTSRDGKEKRLTEDFEQLSRERKVEFRWCPISTEMNQPNGVPTKAAEFADVSNWLELRKGQIIARQTKYIRSNCTSSLDRTGVFGCILSSEVMKKFTPLAKERLELWRDQANQLAWSYVLAPSQKVMIPFFGHQTVWGETLDWINRGWRYFNSLFFEGRMDDAYAAVCQERKVFKLKPTNFFVLAWTLFTLIVSVLVTGVSQGKSKAGIEWKTGIRQILSHPLYRDTRDADEVD